MKKSVKKTKSNSVNVKVLSFVLASALLVVGAGIVLALVAPANGHTSGQIYIDYTGSPGATSNCYVTLQNALDHGYFSPLFSSVSSADCVAITSSDLVDGHLKWGNDALAKDVVISIKGTKMTLQDAVESNSIRGKALISGLSTIPSFYENSSRIGVSYLGSDTTLQGYEDAICDPTVTCSSALPGSFCSINPYSSPLTGNCVVSCSNNSICSGFNSAPADNVNVLVGGITNVTFQPSSGSSIGIIYLTFTAQSSNPGVATASVTGNVLSVAGVSAGTASITLTDSYGNTFSIPVKVQSLADFPPSISGATSLSVSSVNHALGVSVTLSGGSGSYIIKTAPSIASASISGNVLTLSDFGSTSGSSNMVLGGSSSYLGISLTSSNPGIFTSQLESLSRVTMVAGTTVTSTIVGGSGGYSIGTSPNSSVATASISGTVLSITGVAVGSTSLRVTDGNKNITVDVNIDATPSPFMVPNITIMRGSDAHITILGGQAPYNVRSDSYTGFWDYNNLPSITQDVLSFHGQSVGSGYAVVNDNIGNSVRIFVNVTDSPTTYSCSTYSLSGTPFPFGVCVPFKGGYQQSLPGCSVFSSDTGCSGAGSYCNATVSITPPASGTGDYSKATITGGACVVGGCKADPSLCTSTTCSPQSGYSCYCTSSGTCQQTLCPIGQTWDGSKCITPLTGQPCTPPGGCYVTNSGITSYDGSGNLVCVAGSYLPKGTDCGSGGITACDGSGHCTGFSGTGCSSCPAGSYNQPGFGLSCHLSGGYTGRENISYFDTRTGALTSSFWGSWSTSYDPICSSDYTYCCGGYLLGICFGWCQVNYDVQWQMKPSS